MDCGMYNIEYWADHRSLSSIMSFEYWNNEEIERNKETDVKTNGFDGFERHLEESNLGSDLDFCFQWLEAKGRPLKGRGIDLAAGNLWAVPRLIRNEAVEHVHCLEFSEYRLVNIGPTVLKHYEVPPDKVTLVVGSFYELKLNDASLDFVLLSAALHHADEPERLLKEVSRVLKPDGVVIIIGEHINPTIPIYLKHFSKFVIGRIVPDSVQKKLLGKTFTGTKLFVESDELIRPDPVLGDHYFTDARYRSLFSQAGLKLLRRGCRRGEGYQSFILSR